MGISPVSVKHLLSTVKFQGLGLVGDATISIGAPRCGTYQLVRHLGNEDVQDGGLVTHLLSHHGGGILNCVHVGDLLDLHLDPGHCLHLVRGDVAGIVAGTCGYSGIISPSTAAIFWENQDL